MLFDLLRVATDLGCQVESLLSGVQQQQQQQSQAAANQRELPRQMTAASRQRHRAPVCKPLDLSVRLAPLSKSTASPELNNNNNNSNNLDEDAPLNLVVKSELEGRQTLSDSGARVASNCSSTASPASSISLGALSSRCSSSFRSSDTCDNHPNGPTLMQCDNNNNNNEQDFKGSTSALASSRFDELRTTHRSSSNEVQISSTNGRRQRRRRVGASGKSSAGSLQQQLAPNGAKKTRLKSHLCQFCGRSFSRSDMLTRHSRLHSGLKPYQCAKCLQVFSRSDHLSTHERTHTGEKPYQCQFCAYSACRRDMITRHLRTHTLGRLGDGARKSATATSNGRARRTRRGKRDEPRNGSGRDDDVSTSAQINLTDGASDQ